MGIRGQEPGEWTTGKFVAGVCLCCAVFFGLGWLALFNFFQALKEMGSGS